MRLLTDLVSETENILDKDKKSVVEINVQSEPDADSLIKALTKYDIKKVAIISRDQPTTYTLHVRYK